METIEKQDIKSYLDGLGVKFSSREDWNDYAPEMWESSFHYRVKISYEGRKMGLWFYMGRGNKNAPTLDGVMECLISDLMCIKNGLDDFGDEFGWDKNTTKTYQAIKKNTDKLLRVFGVDVLEKLENIIYA
jgi:hypothetical protein